jgi:glutamate dehydrogenase (NADP+)
MTTTTEDAAIAEFMETVKHRNPNEPEFHQAVYEIAQTIVPYVEEHPAYREGNVLERLIEPERTVSFRVPWVDDHNRVQVNRGYRVQFNAAIGPYKGGLRFHPTVNQSILKFLGFEQIFKNALTTLPLGGGKGGADFNPKGRSDGEIMRFCQSFMTELYRHIGPETDVPAGDIGVGGREVGYMFGQYKRLSNTFAGVLTGKGTSWGGSLIRPEATGYGLVYFTEQMLNRFNHSVRGKTTLVSGSGDVSLFAIEKVNELGGKVVTASDSGGTVYDPNGIDDEKLAFLKELKLNRRGRIHEYAEQFNVPYYEGERPWQLVTEARLALPCATENELNSADAQHLVNANVMAMAEGANMPTTAEAIDVLQQHRVLIGPGKAANAGGVATSGLEMTQNAMRLSWTSKEVDQKLYEVMRDIHDLAASYGQQDDGMIDYVKGANLAGFVKVANAMLDQGVV